MFSNITLSLWGHLTDVPINHKKCMWIPLLGMQQILLSLIGIEERTENVKEQIVWQHQLNQALMSKCTICPAKLWVVLLI